MTEEEEEELLKAAKTKKAKIVPVQNSSQKLLLRKSHTISQKHILKLYGEDEEDLLNIAQKSQESLKKIGAYHHPVEQFMQNKIKYFENVS